MVPEFTQALTFLASAVGVGAILSFFFTTAPGIKERFAALSGTVKWWVIFGLSLGLPLAATLIIQLVPPEILLAVEPYWKSLAYAFLAWDGTQATYTLTRNRL